MPSPSRLQDSGNHILNCLPDDEFDRLKPMLQKTSLTLKHVLHQSAAEIPYVYFPTTALCSLLMVMEEDDPVEVATVGKEGMVGVEVALGIRISQYRVICQMGGEILRLPVPQFVESLKTSPALADLVRRYTAYSMRNVSQTLACNTLHTIDSRACRWLLLIHDQAGGDEFPMTQEFLAYMLGVRRQSVTVVAGTLQGAGLIDYRRGTITVRDRAGLEQATCECYAAIREYYKKVMI